jgi:hypothetical protein
VAIFVFAHALLGFALGGLVPGGVLMAAAGLFAAGAATLDAERFL